MGDGVRDDGPAFARALAAADERALPLFVPAGTFLITDRVIQAGSRFIAPRGMIFGEGARSVLRFRRAAFPAFYGIGVDKSGFRMRDLTLEMDRDGGGNWVAGVAVIAAASDLAFERVTFRGVGDRSGHFGILPVDADIDGLRLQTCHFERLDFGFLKQTSDVSTQSGIQILDCTGVDCTEVLEFNSPGLFRARVVAGSPHITDLSDDDSGNPFGLTKLRPGMEIRSIYLPPRTTVSAIEPSGRVRLSAAALRSSPAADKARFSVGGCRNGVIRNLRVRRIHQWAVGFAHCENWQVEVQGEDVAYELVHIEDGSRGFEIVAGGVRCNLSRGVVGSPGADNGMVHISSGSSDISVRFADADLRQSGGGTPNALCVQAGGLMGTTGREIPPARIRVGGRILLRAGAKAVVAYDSDLTFLDLELLNDAGSRASPMMVLNGSRWSGGLRVRHPGALVAPHARLPGRFDRVTTLAD